LRDKKVPFTKYNSLGKGETWEKKKEGEEKKKNPGVSVLPLEEVWSEKRKIKA